MTQRFLLLIGAIMELGYGSFYLLPASPNEVLWFIGVNAVSFALYAVIVFRLRRNTASFGSQAIYWIVGFGIVFRLTLAFHPVVGSDDIYRYIWDGKVAAHGINPFRFSPTDSALAEFHTEVLPARINCPTLRTIYPPLAQAFFVTAYALSGDSPVGLKLLLVVADALTILLLVTLSRSYKLDPVMTALLYAWSPLPIMYFALDGHIDALGIPFLLLFILLASKHKPFAAAIAFGFSVLAKLYPLFVAPALCFMGKGWRRVALPFIPLALLLLGGWWYWEPTGGLIDSLHVFGSTFAFNGSVFRLLKGVLLSDKEARLVCAILFFLWIAAIFYHKGKTLELVFRAFLGFIIFAPVVHPWYMTWLAALLSLRWSTAVFVLLGFSNLTNFVVYQKQLTGIWRDSVALGIVEYAPFYILLGMEVVRDRFRKKA